jgi:hypothetical protein
MQLTGTRKTLKRRIDALRRESTSWRSPEPKAFVDITLISQDGIRIALLKPTSHPFGMN